MNLLPYLFWPLVPAGAGPVGAPYFRAPRACPLLPPSPPIRFWWLVAACPNSFPGSSSSSEGPAVDRRGNVFFTDQPNDAIWQYDTAGRLSLFMQPAGRANGLYFDRRGNLLACADEHNQLWSISPAKKVTVLGRRAPRRRRSRRRP